MILQRVHAFIKHKRQVRMLSNRKTFMIGKTGLLESHSDASLSAKVGDGISNLKRLVLFPSGVGIGDG